MENTKTEETITPSTIEGSQAPEGEAVGTPPIEVVTPEAEPIISEADATPETIQPIVETVDLTQTEPISPPVEEPVTITEVPVDPVVTQEPEINPDPVVEPTSLQSSQLLAALYKIWDAFERSNMKFFLVYKTAENAIAHKELEGDKVEVGVRRLEWVSGGRRIIDAFITPTSETPDRVEYNFDGVPVVVYVYDDHDCIVNTDLLRYRYEEFRIPNPYSKFLEIYPKNE